MSPNAHCVTGLGDRQTSAADRRIGAVADGLLSRSGTARRDVSTVFVMRYNQGGGLVTTLGTRVAFSDMRSNQDQNDQAQ